MAASKSGHATQLLRVTSLFGMRPDQGDDASPLDEFAVDSYIGTTIN